MTFRRKLGGVAMEALSITGCWEGALQTTRYRLDCLMAPRAPLWRWSTRRAIPCRVGWHSCSWTRACVATVWSGAGSAVTTTDKFSRVDSWLRTEYEVLSLPSPVFRTQY